MAKRSFALLGSIVLSLACANGDDPPAGTSAGSLGPGDDTTSTSDGETGSASEGSTSVSDLSTTIDPTVGLTTGGESGDESSSGTGPLEPVDLADGTWVFENVSDSKAMSLHANRTWLDDGTEVVAWSEAMIDNISVLNIVGATRAGGAWSSSAVTMFDDWQNTFPDLAAGGAIALLAWTGRDTQAADLDIFFAASDGSLWSEARSVTREFDMPTPLQETEPVIMRRPTGEVVVAYAAAEASKVIPIPPTIYVSEFLVDNNPATQIAVADDNDGTCSDVVGAMTTDGVAHILIKCSDGGQSGLIHATDRSGDWDSDDLAGVGTGILTPRISADADGDVHAAWVQDFECGADTCDDIFYASTTDDIFGTPLNVSNSANLDERFPTVGVDPFGRVLVFSQARVDGIVDLYLAISEDGLTFAPPERISPNDNEDSYQTPNDVLFDAAGLPSVTAELLFRGSDPLNIDIIVGRFMPN